MAENVEELFEQGHYAIVHFLKGYVDELNGMIGDDSDQRLLLAVALKSQLTRDKGTHEQLKKAFRGKRTRQNKVKQKLNVVLRRFSKNCEINPPIQFYFESRDVPMRVMHFSCCHKRGQVSSSYISLAELNEMLGTAALYRSTSSRLVMGGAQSGESEKGMIALLDGCTYLRVAELICEDESTREERQKHSQLYRNALEDLVFAVMLFDNIGADENMWPCGQGGEETRSIKTVLTGRLGADLEEKLATISNPYGLDETASKYRQEIIKDIRNLEYADSNYWKAHVERDARHYLGEDSSLSNNLLDYSEYEFKKTYLKYDLDFFKHVPTKLVEACIERVKDIQGDVCQRACEVFVCKVLVAHVVGLFSYVAGCGTVEPGMVYCDYLPSEGRANLLKLPGHPEHMREARSCWSKVSMFMLPYCLGLMVHRCDNKKKFVEQMVHIAGADPYLITVRSKLKKIRGELEARDYKAVDTLIRELATLVQARNRPQPVLQYFRGLEGSGHSGMWGQAYVKNWLSLPSYHEVISQLCKIFPDTFRPPK